jgi:hypothetical protein
MFSTRGHLELFVGVIVLVVLLATAASRTVTMTDRSQHQALKTAGAHFVAGIEMLQAESRLVKHHTLNAVGYPTGRSGVLQDDADCEAIWRATMQSSTASVAIRFVADADGGGDRCEFQLVDPAMRILYWPTGVGAATVALGRDTIRVTRGAHVHVEVDDASS